MLLKDIAMWILFSISERWCGQSRLPEVVDLSDWVGNLWVRRCYPDPILWKAGRATVASGVKYALGLWRRVNREDVLRI